MIKLWAWTKRSYKHISDNNLLSNVAVAFICFIAAAIWKKVTNTTWVQMVESVQSFLLFKLPIGMYLSFFGVYYIFSSIKDRFKKGRKKKQSALYHVPIGHYTFGELVQILQSQTLTEQDALMKEANIDPPKETLLEMFANNYTKFVLGATHVSFQDNGYSINYLCPKLLGYGLVDRQEMNNGKYKYTISAHGKVFYSNLEKFMLENPK